MSATAGDARAFAREVAESYTLHARQIAFDARTGPGRIVDLPELAGQLTMDLDQAPDIAALRQVGFVMKGGKIYRR